MITTFGINSKKYSDFPLLYAPATGFKWRLVSAYVLSSNTGMTVAISLRRNNVGVVNILSSTGAEYFDAFGGAGAIRYGVIDIGSLDSLKVNQSGGATGYTVSAVIKVEVLPA